MRSLLISLLLIGLTFILSGCAVVDWVKDLFVGDSTLSKQEIVLKTASDDIQLTVEVADDEKEREKGLMERDKIDENAGMLFVFADEAPRRFWMKNTRIPLDIIFFNSKKEAIFIIENMTPCQVGRCPSYSSQEPAMYALELPAGYVKNRNIGVGDTFIEAES